MLTVFLFMLVTQMSLFLFSLLTDIWQEINSSCEYAGG